MNVQMILFVIFTISILFILTDVIYVESEQIQSDPMWSFGENLKTGDLFSYHICEYSLHIPELPEPCYDITMHFLHLLPTTYGNTWIVATEIFHAQKQINTVFHIDADSFEITSEGATIQYASSLERNLEWIKKYAHKMRPQSLVVGKSWGVVATDAGSPITLMVSQTDFMTAQNDDFVAYKIGYELTKESYVYVKDGFPFPLEMAIYKPVSGQLQPLMFTATLISHSVSHVFCDPPTSVPKIPSYFGAKIELDKGNLSDQNKPHSYHKTSEQGNGLPSESKTTDAPYIEDSIGSSVISYAKFLEIIKNMTGQNIGDDIHSSNKTIVGNVTDTVSKIAENNTINVH